MGDAIGDIPADNIALRIDTEDSGQRGAWEIDGSEGALMQQEAMIAAAAIYVPADDVALGVDTESTGGRSAWEIDGGEGALAEQEAMGDAIRIIKADYISLRTDTAGKGSSLAASTDEVYRNLPKF